jgi:hypothetical protein
MDWLNILSSVAAILTAVVAVTGYGRYVWERKRKERKLVDYLKGLKGEARSDKGQRSALHLTARVGLTEAEILQASFRNSRIHRVMRTDDDGFASAILFEYRD